MRDLVVIGMGHIGGSVAIAAKSRSLFARVIGVESSPQARGAARDASLADMVVEDAATAGARAELVIVAVPVRATAEACLRALATHRAAVVSDVAGLKADVVSRIEREGGMDAARFVGGHPMAGTTGSGPGSASASLFEGARVVLTPGPAVESRALSVVEAFWRGLGAVTVRENAAEHDRAIAALSHLPHALAYSLAKTAAEILDADATLGATRAARLAGPSFSSATRVASSDPTRWTELFADARAPLSDALGRFSKTLAELAELIARADSPDGEKALAAFLTHARALADAEHGG